MKKIFLILLCLIATTVVAAPPGHYGPYDPGAARANLSNVDTTASPSMTSITLSDKVRAAWADILGDIYASGTVKVSTGTAAAPAYSFSSDPDTGIYSAGADTLAFSTAGTDRARIDARGNLGVGIVPSDWSIAYDVKAIQLNGGAIYTYDNNRIFLGNNVFLNSTGADTYIATGAASTYRQYQGAHSWYVAPSGDGGSPVSLSEAARIAPTGNVLIGTTTDDGVNKLQVNGSIRLIGGAAPTAIEGTIYFNSTDKHFYGYNGTAWVQLDN